MEPPCPPRLPRRPGRARLGRSAALASGVRIGLGRAYAAGIRVGRNGRRPGLRPASRRLVAPRNAAAPWRAAVRRPAVRRPAVRRTTVRCPAVRRPAVRGTRPRTGRARGAATGNAAAADARTRPRAWPAARPAGHVKPARLGKPAGRPDRRPALAGRARCADAGRRNARLGAAAAPVAAAPTADVSAADVSAAAVSAAAVSAAAVSAAARRRRTRRVWRHVAARRSWPGSSPRRRTASARCCPR